jgi:hypothetical protein
VEVLPTLIAKKLERKVPVFAPVYLLFYSSELDK